MGGLLFCIFIPVFFYGGKWVLATWYKTLFFIFQIVP